ncbi:hypothetical protein LCGC14_0233390 [marine sediment metagenome]|uniref:Phytase-like domain-containing protein n=1 Tax=marine sediment metagenome TaxID=412755 RepID=A0A0F9WUE4_9ZZZZ
MIGKGFFATGAALVLSVATQAQAFQPSAELTLQQAWPVEGMLSGNLSGLAACGEQIQAVSDREDNIIYTLEPGDQTWLATEETFILPEENASHLPLPLLVSAWVRGLGGQGLDIEGISCDEAGNRYLVSEGLLGILQLGPRGGGFARAQWLSVDQALYAQGEKQGLWQQVNALAEGIAVSSDGEAIWLAAERLSRGLLKLEQYDGGWRCPLAGCVLLAERRFLPAEPFGAGVLDSTILAQDFSGLSLWGGRLWTLERNEHQVCRRHPVSGHRERCWSFAETLLNESYRYPEAPFGLAEALVINDQGITIGLDNNGRARLDGDTRPWVFRFALPDDWQHDYTP